MIFGNQQTTSVKNTGIFNTTDTDWLSLTYRQDP